MTTTIEELNSKMIEARRRARILGLHTDEGCAAADQYLAYHHQLTTWEREARYAKQVAKQSAK